MPSRVLREGINSSELVNALSLEAELLYRRLMSVVDDYGRFYASPATVRGACWPTCPEKVCEQDVGRLLSECAQIDSSGKSLLTIYAIGKAKYLQINNFNQQVRTKSKFPEPCNQSEINLKSDCEQNASTSRRRESYFEGVRRESEPNAEAPHSLQQIASTASEAGIPKQPRKAPVPFPENRIAERGREWLAKYPNQVDVDAAMREWISLVTSEQAADEHFQALERYAASAKWRNEAGEIDVSKVKSPLYFIRDRNFRDSPEPFAKARDSPARGDKKPQFLSKHERDDIAAREQFERLSKERKSSEPGIHANR